VKRSPNGAALLDANGSALRYDQPLFTEDYTGLRDLDEYYGGELLMVGSLFEAAHARGLTTVAIGKSGPAYLQDRHRLGAVFDEKAVWPLELVKELQKAGLKLPKATAEAYQPGEVTIDEAANGSPTTIPPSTKLPDGKTTDPTSDAGAPGSASNAYLMDVYLKHLLPDKAPELTVLWNRNPDTAQHWYGPGTRQVKAALRENDTQLGALLDTLTQLGWLESTNVVVVSDHGHSSVSGPLDTFPLRSIEGTGADARVGAINASGFSVSGDVRLADLLARIGRFHAYDGIGCLYDPVMSGIGVSGKPLYAVRTDDAKGRVCGVDPKTGKGSAKYTTPAYRIPSPVPKDAVVVALNGGTDAVYVPSHDAALVQRVARFLQARPEVGVVFQSSRYPAMPGVLPMDGVRIESKDQRRNADLLVSYAYDENATVQGMKGTIYEGAQSYRGMHGSFSPADIHNTLIALGPDFRKSWKDDLPTGNADVAPTIAKILGLELPKADGRTLDEALVGGATPPAYELHAPEQLSSTAATRLEVISPGDTDGTRVDQTKNRYRSMVQFRDLGREGRVYRYFDWARAVRE
jgi:arylsulfatase A-like enzyme